MCRCPSGREPTAEHESLDLKRSAACLDLTFWPGWSHVLGFDEGDVMADLSLDGLFSVAGKVVLVTGGSRGIGEMIASGFLANGAKVYISSRKAHVCDATAARLSETSGGTCVSIPADLATVEGVASLAAAIQHREDHLDVLVNNAGASWGAPLDDFPENGWDKVMDTNVKGVFFLTQRLLPLLEAAATPDSPSRVINIGSI